MYVRRFFWIHDQLFHVASTSRQRRVNVTSTMVNVAQRHLTSSINRTQGKSVSLKKLARAFALERQQSPVSYVGIDIVSRTILKIMYRTISKSTFDDESR